MTSKLFQLITLVHLNFQVLYLAFHHFTLLLIHNEELAWNVIICLTLQQDLEQSDKQDEILWLQQRLQQWKDPFSQFVHIIILLIQTINFPHL